MSDIRFYMLTSSIAVNIDGQSVLISEGDHRYCRVREAIESGQISDLARLVDPSLSLGIEHVEVSGGMVIYRGDQLPTALGNKLVDFKISDKPFLPLFNFWLNKKNRGEKISTKMLACLSQDECYPLTDDGFFFVFDGSKLTSSLADEVLFGGEEKMGGSVSFYNYSALAPEYAVFFEQRQSLREVAAEVFGFEEPKLLKLLAKNLFPPQTTFGDSLAQAPLLLGTALSGALSKNNRYSVWEKGLFTPGAQTEVADMHAVGELLSSFSETKIMNVLERPFDFDSLVMAASHYRELAETEQFDIRAVQFSTVGELNELLHHEAIKNKDSNFSLRQEQHTPELAEVNGAEIPNGMKLVVAADSHQLILWSRLMKNCIGNGGYAKRARSGGCILLGVEKAGKLIYTIEIVQGQVKQFVTTGNESISQPQRQPVIDLLTKKGILRNKPQSKTKRLLPGQRGRQQGGGPAGH